MTGQEQNEIRIETPHDGSYENSSTKATQNLTPLERWKNEKDTDQPWNAIDFFKTSSGLRKCASNSGTPSTKTENGSVDEERK